MVEQGFGGSIKNEGIEVQTLSAAKT